jgi:hypothetical protein
VERAAHNRLVNINITIPDFKVKAAIRIGANPGFIVNRCSLTAKIRQGHQISGIALLTLGIINLFHEVLLPTKIIKETDSVYTKLRLLTSALSSGSVWFASPNSSMAESRKQIGLERGEEF